MNIELIASAIAAHRMPYQPEAVWYITEQKAVLGISYPLQTLLKNPKTLTTVDWLPMGALLVIVWATQVPEELMEILLDIAGDCGIPPTITIDL